jgi:hypothetical protein
MQRKVLKTGNRQTDRQTDRRTDRRTDGQTVGKLLVPFGKAGKGLEKKSINKYIIQTGYMTLAFYLKIRLKMALRILSMPFSIHKDY